MNNNIIGVQFSEVGKIYFFDSSNYQEIKINDHVIVNTTRGLQLAKVVKTDIETTNISEEIKLIERPATSRDLILRQMIAEKEKEAVYKIRDLLKEEKIKFVKVISAEYSFDGRRLSIYINAESDPQFSIKEFFRIISPLFPDNNIEIRQLGPRDVAKALGGMGACGLESRCCSKFLLDFNSISIRMAKTQDISLTPSEITGMCGRLRCCLQYEYDFYLDAKKNLPKRKKIVNTPMGEGKVVQVLPLKQSVIVELPDFGPREFSKDELESGELIEVKKQSNNFQNELQSKTETLIEKKSQQEILSSNLKPPNKTRSKPKRSRRRQKK